MATKPKPSIVDGLTYGDTRKYLNRIYMMGPAAQANMVLPNGQTFGDFCLKYMLARHLRIHVPKDARSDGPKRSRKRRSAAADLVVDEFDT